MLNVLAKEKKKERKRENSFEVSFYDGVPKRWVFRAFINAGLEQLSFKEGRLFQSFGEEFANARTPMTQCVLVGTLVNTWNPKATLGG